MCAWAIKTKKISNEELIKRGKCMNLNHSEAVMKVFNSVVRSEATTKTFQFKLSKKQRGKGGRLFRDGELCVESLDWGSLLHQTAGETLLEISRDNNVTLSHRVLLQILNYKKRIR